jgi:hypothetical protein
MQAVGGRSPLGTRLGDAVVADGLPQSREVVLIIGLAP